MAASQYSLPIPKIYILLVSAPDARGGGINSVVGRTCETWLPEKTPYRRYFLSFHPDFEICTEREKLLLINLTKYPRQMVSKYETTNNPVVNRANDLYFQFAAPTNPSLYWFSNGFVKITNDKLTLVDVSLTDHQIIAAMETCHAKYLSSLLKLSFEHNDINTLNSQKLHIRSFSTTAMK